MAVLFADLVGYIRPTAELDVEEVHALLDRFFQGADRIVGELGGRVLQHIGDCVMAAFGAPMAFGNDTERAVRAALAIRDATPRIGQAVGRDLAVHVGVASGPVIAGEAGSAIWPGWCAQGPSGSPCWSWWKTFTGRTTPRWRTWLPWRKR